MSTTIAANKSQCSLLLFLATPAEEEGLKAAANALDLNFETIPRAISPWREEYHWFGQVGNETVIAVRPARDGGHIVMGSVGRLGSAARAIRLKTETGAQGIVQIGMAFGIDPARQQLGDVLVSTSVIPYDNRIIRAAPQNSVGYECDYSQANREPARPALVELFRREQARGEHSFDVYLGAMLSGAARIHSGVFRDKLAMSVPAGDDRIVGGEMEGVGLLAASTAGNDPIWCIVKGISDFADENRDSAIAESRPVACRNAADFVLAALLNDARIE